MDGFQCPCANQITCSEESLSLVQYVVQALLWRRQIISEASGQAAVWKTSFFLTVRMLSCCQWTEHCSQALSGDDCLLHSSALPYLPLWLLTMVCEKRKNMFSSLSPSLSLLFLLPRSLKLHVIFLRSHMALVLELFPKFQQSQVFAQASRVNITMCEETCISSMPVLTFFDPSEQVGMSGAWPRFIHPGSRRDCLMFFQTQCLHSSSS